MKKYKWNYLDTDERTLKAAKKEKPENLRTDDPYAFFVGRSGEYDTTLSSCTCLDFIINRRDGRTACKHIVRLAMELGMIDENGSFTDMAELNDGIRRQFLRRDMEKLAFAAGMYHLYGERQMSDKEYDSLKCSVFDRINGK